MKTMKTSKRGFTLIELLIVIAIIGVLASIVLVGLGSFRSRGRDARRVSDIRETQNALEIYYAKYQQYPTASSWGEMVNVIVNGGVGVSNIANDPLFVPNDPASRSYSYGAGAGNQNYALMTTLEDAGHPSLKDDVDGTVFGVNCDDAPSANYCVKF